MIISKIFHWSGGTQSGANLVVLAAHTDDGVVGYGESVCEDPRAIVAYGELMARQIVGHSPGDVEAILREIWTVGRSVLRVRLLPDPRASACTTSDIWLRRRRRDHVEHGGRLLRTPRSGETCGQRLESGAE